MSIPFHIKQILRLAKKTPLGQLLFVEVLAGLLWNIASLVLFVHLTKDVLEKDVFYFDRLISDWIYRFRIPALTVIMKFITTIGNAPFGSLLAVLVILLLIKKHRKEAWLFSLSLIVVSLLNTLMKLTFQLPRPQIAPLISVYGYTYPSGHAMNNLVLYGLLAFYTYHFTRNKTVSILASIAAAVWIGLIGFSRIYLGVHYPSDVIAGYLAGFWWLVTVLLIDKTLGLRKEIRDFKE